MAIDDFQAGSGNLADAYGRHIVGGILLHHSVETVGNEKQVKVKTLLGKGPWDSVEKVFYDGQEIDAANWTFHPGTISTGAADAVQGADARFPDTLYHSGIAYITVTLPPGVATEDRPDKIRVLARTRKVSIYNSSGVETSVAYSTNPADHFVDLIKRNCALIGKPVTDYIDWPAYVAARNWYATSLDQPNYTDVPRNFKASPAAGGSIPTGNYILSLQARTGSDHSIQMAPQLVIITSGSQSINYQFEPVTGVSEYVMWAKAEDGTYYRWTISGATANDDGLYISSVAALGTTDTPAAPSGLYILSRPRFESHIAFTSPVSLNEALNRLCVHCCSDWQRDGKKYRILTPEDRAHSFHFDEGNTIPGSFRRFQVARDERTNRFTINFRDVVSAYNEQADPPVTVDRPALQTHAGIIEESIELAPMSRNQAVRIASFRARMMADLPDRFVVTDDGRYPNLLPGDIGTISDSGSGVTNARVVILEIEDSESDSLQNRTYTLQQLPLGVYSDTDTTPIVSVKPTAIANRFASPDAPSSLTLTQETKTNRDGTVNLAVSGQVQFAAHASTQTGMLYHKGPGEASYKYIAAIIPAPSTGLGGFFVGNLLASPSAGAGDLHYFKVVPISSSGIEGSPIIQSIQVLPKSTAPTAPTTRATRQVAARVVYEWNPSADRDVAGYNVYNTSDTLLGFTAATSWEEAASSATSSIKVRAVNSSGVESATTTTLTYNYPSLSAPTISVQTNTPTSILIGLSTLTDADKIAQIARTEIQAADNSGFTTNVILESKPGYRTDALVPGKSGTTRYIRARYVTTFGTTTSWSNVLSPTLATIGDFNAALGNLYFDTDDLYTVGLRFSPFGQFRPQHISASRSIYISGSAAAPEILFYAGNGSNQADTTFRLEGNSNGGSAGYIIQDYWFDNALRWYWRTDYVNEDIYFKDGANREYLRFKGGDGVSTKEVILTGAVDVVGTFTVNGSPVGASGSLVVGSSPIGSGTAGRVMYEASGNLLGEVSGFTSDGTNVTAGSGNLRATSPRFTTSIDDSNGNEVIKITATSSAVNEITITNAASGNTPSITATGTDTNISLQLAGKGTGQVYANGDVIVANNSAATLSSLTTGTITGPTTISVKSTSSSSATFDSGTTGAVNVGTGSNPKTLTLGSTNTTSTTNIRSGSGGINLSGGNVTLGAGLLLKLSGGSSGTIDFAAAGSTSSYSLVWPASQAVGTTVLTNDGSGNLSWEVASGATEIAIGSTPVSGGASGKYLYNNGGVVGEITVGTGVTAAIGNAVNASGGLATVDGTATLSGKTLTAPRFVSGGFIADANGNEQIIFTTTASAVNEITVANAAAGGTPQISATGGDTNISLLLAGKGSGQVYANGDVIVANNSAATLASLTTGTITGPTTISVKSTSSSSATFDSGTTGAVNIGTGNNAKTTTVGSTNTTSTLNLRSGSGGINLSGGNVSLAAGLTFKLTGGTSGTVDFAAAASTSSYSLVWPDAQASGIQYLRNDGSGNLSWATVSGGGGADTALSNLASVAINTALLPGTNNSVDLGSTSKWFREAYLGASASFYGKLTAAPTANRTWTLPDASITVAGSSSALTSGRVPFATTGGLLTDSANLYWDNTNGRLGIGTTSPQSSFHIHGNNTRFQFTNAGTGSGSTDGLWFGETGGGSSSFEFWNFENGYFRFATNNTEILRLLTTGAAKFFGNVGIGADPTSEPLYVSTAGNSYKAKLSNGTVTIGAWCGTAGSIGTSTNHDFALFANGSDRITIKSTGEIALNGSYAPKSAAVSTNTTLDATHHYVRVDTSAARTITLPTAVGITSRTYVIIDATGSAATNNITISTTSSQNINGSPSSRTINTAYGYLKVMSDGTGWLIVP